MNKKLFIVAFVLLSAVSAVGQTKEAEKAFIRENMDFATQQYGIMLKNLPQDKRKMPHSALHNGKIVLGDITGWTSGFFPGTLWYLADYEQSQALRDSALVYSRRMEPVKTLTSHHDIGFMMNCSYGNAQRFTPSSEFKDILVTSARSLSTRFREKAGVIQSWNNFTSWQDGTKYDLPVIIDNMMNLELLFNASKLSGDKNFRRIAISHAEKTMQNQVRSDYSCFHVVLYDKATGRMIKGETAQGYSDNSTWSRGEAWGIYGFTMCYRETRDARFLKTAEGMADYYVNSPNLPSDKVTWWDFNAYQLGYQPGPRSNARNLVTNYRDASAAAVVASALLELSTYVPAEKGQKYLDCAKQIMHSLGSPLYRARLGENNDFILMHSVGSIPHNNEIDVPLVYADYYFIEALYRYNRLLEGKQVI